MGELINEIVTKAAITSTIAEPKPQQDEYGLWHFKELPSKARLILPSEANYLQNILQPGIYFLVESAITGYYYLHKVSHSTRIRNLIQYIQSQQLFLYR